MTFYFVAILITDKGVRFISKGLLFKTCNSAITLKIKLI